ncbi:hypothetical protein MGI18_07625 [Bacillus sp. OVS6]|nr:hypothetical protein [Metabacillus dongyingensis]UAL53392.1 hypothetical protein K8L98_06260 [Metabacillus dongyingensis]UOK58887.1 hypothetical protein MGI18_07625 [Bacillus sp. OVS6]
MSRKIVLFIAISLDGYIARRQHLMRASTLDKCFRTEFAALNMGSDTI